eukprot:GEMP01038848.1.p1 GENE.GEMP01038848.1~~GEMP01038848.1.p1  ORF type:complete len:350 (+),score=79.62 GEMP01038848.1:171-1220(+)
MFSSTLRCSSSDLEKDLTGKTVIITGGNSGIGKVAAMQLFKQGATVVIGSRKVENGTAVADKLKETSDANSVDERFFVQQLDLADFDSVRAFVTSFEEHHSTLHILLNNAGVMNTPFSRTKQGHEIQMGVNHIGHFLLTKLLIPVLIKTATDACPSRIINTSSCFAVQHWPFATARINWADFHWRLREDKYSPVEAYGQSKLANYLHALELSKRLQYKNIIAVSLHPGFVESDLFRHTNKKIMALLKFLPTGMINTWDGTQTTLHCCLTDDLKGGAFYSQRGSPVRAYPMRCGGEIGWPCTSPLPSPQMTYSNAKVLWSISESTVKDVPTPAIPMGDASPILTTMSVVL